MGLPWNRTTRNSHGLESLSILEVSRSTISSACQHLSFCSELMFLCVFFSIYTKKKTAPRTALGCSILGPHPHHDRSWDFESALVLRDGSPSFPKPQKLWTTETWRKSSSLRSWRDDPPARARQNGDRKYRNTSESPNLQWISSEMITESYQRQ